MDKKLKDFINKVKSDLNLNNTIKGNKSFTVNNENSDKKK